MSIFSKIIGGASYDDLWQAIIRPPRDHYNNEDLGPSKFCISSNNYKRSDFTIVNKRNLKLSCSWWEPFDEEREYNRLPCVIYLHGNSSSKAEAYPEANILLPMNICLFAFDFSGCGRSEGEYISLGYYEKMDVECIVEYLRKSNKVSTIGLWGRSMGAVTALMYGDSDPTVAGMVLDSPFSSLKLLVEELVSEKITLPKFILSQAIKMVKNSVKKKAFFDLDDIEPIKYAERCYIPALFTSANDDDFVKPHHSKYLYDVYKGDKNIIKIEGDHNSIRCNFFKNSAAIFFHNALQLDKIEHMSNAYDNCNLNSCSTKELKFDKNFINALSNNNDYKDTNNKNINNPYNLVDNNNNININFEDYGQEEKAFQKVLSLSKKDNFKLKNNINNKHEIIHKHHD